jgi:hypothetical protein
MDSSLGPTIIKCHNCKTKDELNLNDVGRQPIHNLEVASI